MANVTSTQIILDGPRNTVVKVEGILDTSDLASFVVADPATLAGWDNTGLQKSAKLSLLKVTYSIEDALEVRLAWDATTPARLVELTGRGKISYYDIGGVTNNADAGVNGKVLLSTEGWSAGKILSFTVILHFKKQQF